MNSYKDKLNSLPEKLKSFFVSDFPTIEIKKSFCLFEVSPKLSINITKEIGLMYIKELPLTVLPDLIKKNVGISDERNYGIAAEINKRIFNNFLEYFTDSQILLAQWSKLKSNPILSEEEAYKKVLELEPWILEEEKERKLEKIQAQKENKQFQERLTSLPFPEALRIYPEVGEQLVTSSKINLRNFPYPVRPSIKNWVADYTFQMGYEKHEAMARSQYLFQGANTKNLSAQEKQKLAYILKSFDENSPITVNKNSKQIIFISSNVISTGQSASSSNLPENLSDQFRPASTPPTEQKNINAMQFSYRQKLPYEKNLPSEIPAGSRSAERISQGSPSEILTQSQGVRHISQGKSQNFPIKTVAPSQNFPAKITPTQNLPKNVVDLKNIQQ